MFGLGCVLLAHANDHEKSRLVNPSNMSSFLLQYLTLSMNNSRDKSFPRAGQWLNRGGTLRSDKQDCAW